MARFIIMAEEGERVLLDQAKETLGLDLSDAELIFTGVGAINIIRSLQHLDREAELINIGYAGSANFDLGTWVEVTEVRLNHPSVTYPEPELKISNQQSTIKNQQCETGSLLHKYRFCAGLRLQRLRLRYGTGVHCCTRFYQPA